MSSETRRTRLVLIRHGESNVTVGRVIGGHRTCSGLSDLGRRQSERLAERLERTGELTADVLLTSDFERAIETADIVRGSLGPAVAGTDVERRHGLGEHDPGPEIDGMTFDAYVERFGSPDWTDLDAEVFPGGETVRRFHERVTTAVDKVVEECAGRVAVVACHGGVVDATFRHLLGLEMTGGFELQTVNTAITEFARPADGSRPWRVVRYNDAAHLAGLPDATERSTDDRVVAAPD
ncbi:histidine phosphatase family protein [Ilumatobacter sp.]|uniref:histidine phosphatase family protein n=1 Tax=Ilumatobacter sp. TaxID=1967498 RepID=UPI003B52FC78